jgi:histidinol dehydrogenase
VFHTVRTYKIKGTRKKWTNEEDMDRTVSSVIRDVSLRGAAALFHIQYSKLKDWVEFTIAQNALREDMI